ncbi:formyltransferase family protein [Castellaniella sp. GW247-6E4]|uniref:methionyl-tRNA formyltransferase n=1 Tax=Castellaniella sp. GW247-6E4 TaxID=3140380 RepID=UPI003315C67B
MRIILITQGISRVVMPLLSSGHEVIGILESMPRGFDASKKKPRLLGLLKKIYNLARKEDVFLPDFCRNRGIPYNFLWKGNSESVARWLRSLKPDLIVVFSMSQLLREEILEIPRLGVINLHPSFLPEYRGPNPDFWQYHNMEMHPGVTVHYVDAGEDTGDIIYQERMLIPLGTKSPDRLNKLIGDLGVPLMLKALDAIAQGHAPRVSQPARSPTKRARNLKTEEYGRLIDWERWPIEQIWHVLRGTELWLDAVPPPAGLFAGQRWSIKNYEKTSSSIGPTGTIGRHKKRRCIFVREGVIYIGIDFDFKRSILRFFQ